MGDFADKYAVIRSRLTDYTIEAIASEFLENLVEMFSILLNNEC